MNMLLQYMMIVLLVSSRVKHHCIGVHIDINYIGNCELDTTFSHCMKSLLHAKQMHGVMYTCKCSSATRRRRRCRRCSARA